MRLRLLLPAHRHLESAIAGSWLARGDRTADVAQGRATVLRECFAIDAVTLPVAALTRSIDAGDAGEAKWLRADPAFVMADAVTLRLLAC
ncbi:MAG TPA: phosphoglycerate mutase, partial [Rudaea sp.]